MPTLGGANSFPDLIVDSRPMGDGPQDQRPMQERDDVAVFTTEPLAEPLPVVSQLRRPAGRPQPAAPLVPAIAPDTWEDDARDGGAAWSTTVP